MVPMFLAAVDQTLLATATPVISRELGGLRDTSWLAVAYLLASVIMVPLYGQPRRPLRPAPRALGRDRRLRARLARLRRRRRRSACWSPRASLQGVGGGGLMTLSQALIGEVVAPRLRARNQSYFAIIFTLASVGGPVIGGLVVHHASWRWLFLVNLPLCALAVWRLRTMLGDDRRAPVRAASPMRPASSCSRSPRRPALVWLSSAGHRFAWASATSIVLLASARSLFGGRPGARRAARRAAVPADRAARRAGVRYAVLTVIGFASAMFAMVFYLPVYLQLALHSNPAESGLLLLPLTGGIVAGAALTGRIIVWTGRPTAIPSVRPAASPRSSLLRPGAAAAGRKRSWSALELHDRPRSRLA